MKRKRVKCPNCGYTMPIEYDKETAKAEGIFVRCKGRNCGQVFEIKVNVNNIK